MANTDSQSQTRGHELRLIEAAISDAESQRPGRGAQAVPAARIGADSFPGYTILREIRRGAQGVVYEAVQRHTNRSVAIKVVAGTSLGGRRARFEREVQILARLRHPNIVTIHDSAMTEDRAFFVMDFIDGMALDEYVKSTGPGVNDLVRLFAQISEAVGVAHLQGVIHRDLKPSNIRIDTQGRPKVLDFGLAKVIEDVDAVEGEAPAVVTHTGQFVGSLPWASPEQAEGGSDELDIRTDVYSMGVMMYQALTGSFPYKVTGSMREVTETICLVDPKRPSSSTGGINDEVDMIVLKCLSKDRERRYQSAVELTRDLSRYLNGEPIDAKRDSSWYVLRKTLRRHRVPVAAGIGLMVLLMVFTASVWLLYRQAQTQKDIAVIALDAEGKARESAETQAKKAKRVQSFLSGMLAAADPFRARERTITLSDALRSAATQLEREAIEEPEVEAGIRHALGTGFMGAGAYGEAEPHVRRAVDLLRHAPGADPADKLDVQRNLVRLLGYQSRTEEALPLAAELLAARRSLHGPKHDATLTSAFDLAMLLRASGRYQEAEADLQQVVITRRESFGDDHQHTIEAVEGLAHVSKDLGQLAKAAELFREVHQRYAQSYGERHPMVITAISNLAALYDDQRQVAEAERYYRLALDLQTAALGDEHPYRLTTLSNLGNLLRQRGSLVEAGAMLREALQTRRRTLGEDHDATITSMINLSLVLQLEGRLDHAEALLREAIAIQKDTLGEQHPQVLIAYSNLSSILWDRHDFEGAAEIMRHVLDGRIALLGEKHPRTLNAMSSYAMALLKVNKVDEAVPWAERSSEIAREVLGPQHVHTLGFRMIYGSALLAAKQYDQAETVLLDTYTRLAEIARAQHEYTAVTRKYLINLYEVTGRPEKARELQALTEQDKTKKTKDR